MKREIKNLLFLLPYFVVSPLIWVVLGQTTFNGVTINGANSGDRFRLEKSLGLIAAYDARRGAFLDGTSGTNVYCWTDLTGNGFNLTQYLGTNQSASVGLVQTNNIQALAFATASGVSNVFLKCDSLAQYFSGEDKPISMVALINDTAINNQAAYMGFGWSGATNSSASQIFMRGHSTANSFVVGHNSNTNSTSTGFNFTPSGTVPATNTWFFMGFNYSGTNGQVWVNLKVSNNTQLDQTTLTADQFTVGAMRVTNGFIGNQRGGRSFIAGLWIYTNYLSSTDMSNVIRNANSSYTTPPF